MQDQFTGYYEDPDEPEITEAEIEEAYLESLEQQAATFPPADFSYELACDAIWEHEAMSDDPLPRRLARIANRTRRAA